jgi:hypothetical protein
MKKHPDCQPRCAVAMDGGNDDDGNDDEQFERKRIYNENPSIIPRAYGEQMEC